MFSETLRRIQCARDTRHLFEALGYTPDRATFDDHVHVVGRWKGFKVAAADAAEPADRARSLALQLSRSGQRAMAVAVGPQRLLALAAPQVGHLAATRALVVSLDQPTREALSQLASLRPNPGSTGLAHALRVAELLSTEVVGERFFIAFRMILERMASSLPSTVSGPERRTVALLPLTRILFLYFVQSKGWLDGRMNYLRALLDHTLSRHRPFHGDTLQSLFFGTLNRPAKARSRHPSLGTIPYLNGGLFEPHPVEHRLGMPTFSNALWRDAFDDVFERFRFCVREAHEVDAIAPDMLGRAFERLMGSSERHQSGTFYTPERIVRQIVEVTVATALGGSGGLSPALVQAVMGRRPLSRRDRLRAVRAVRQLRILDPAAGSGAFLLGTLDLLTDVRASLEEDTEGEHRRVRLRRAVLQENLFGVDINPLAVRLAELRLWLAVVADDPTGEIEAITPLPNLDGVIRQGDTLLDPVGAARACHSSFPGLLSARGVSRVRSARHALFDARGAARSRATTLLRKEEHALACQLLAEALETTERAHADLTAASQDRDLFGRRVGLTPSLERRLRLLEQNREELNRAQSGVKDEILPFFAFEIHTPEIVKSGGFSAVVGNPPWVRAERLSPARRRVLRDRFTLWRGTRRSGFTHLPDLAVAFLERALELTARGGAVGLLVPSKLVSSGYGEPARQHLVRETSIMYAHRVSDREAAQFGATTYPLALVLRKSAPGVDHRVSLDFARTQDVSQRSLAGEGPWILMPGGEQDALTELRAAGRRLQDVAEPSLGLKTGADAVLVGELLECHAGLPTVRFAGFTGVIEAEVLRPALRGRHIRPFSAKSRALLLWGYTADAQPLERLPPHAARYVRASAAALVARSDYRGGPAWTVFRVRAAVSPHRVVWADLARRPRAVALDETEAKRAIPLNTCYVAPAPDRATALVIAAVMNSTWTGVLASAMADEARGKYRRINARVAGQIPIPFEGSQLDELLDLSSRAHQDEDVAQQHLDEVVADALHLRVGTQRTLRRMAKDFLGPTARRR